MTLIAAIVKPTFWLSPKKICAVDGGWVGVGVAGRLGGNGCAAWNENRRLRGGGDGSGRDVAGGSGCVCSAYQQHLADVDLLCFGAVAVEHHDFTARNAVGIGDDPQALAGLNDVINGTICLRR